MKRKPPLLRQPLPCPMPVGCIRSHRRRTPKRALPWQCALCDARLSDLAARHHPAGAETAGLGTQHPAQQQAFVSLASQKVEVDGQSLEVFDACRPADCPRSQLRLVFTPDGKTAWGPGARCRFRRIPLGKPLPPCWRSCAQACGSESEIYRFMQNARTRPATKVDRSCVKITSSCGWSASLQPSLRRSRGERG